MALIRLASRLPSAEGVAWYSDFSASTVRCNLERHLHPYEITKLAKDVDRIVRLVNNTTEVMVCIHVIIHGVMHLSLTIADARCTASIDGCITITAGPASALMAHRE
jgi:hypothetical protein